MRDEEGDYFHLDIGVKNAASSFSVSVFSIPSRFASLRIFVNLTFSGLKSWLRVRRLLRWGHSSAAFKISLTSLLLVS